MSSYLCHVSRCLCRSSFHVKLRPCNAPTFPRHGRRRYQHAWPVNGSSSSAPILGADISLPDHERRVYQLGSPVDDSASPPLTTIRTSRNNNYVRLRVQRYDWGKPGALQTPHVINWSRDSPEIMVDFKQKQGSRVNVDKFSNFWLRDHCPCPECTHPQTKQRQIDTFSIDPDIKVSSIEPSDTGLTIWWANSSHKSHFSWSWLERHRQVPKISSQRPLHMRPKVETGAYPWQAYGDIMAPDDKGLLQYLIKIKRFGFCFAHDTPVTTEATEALLNRIAFIRPTHYGAFWDFTSIANPIDTAYTTLALPAHTDTTYYTDPCGLQLFHILSHTGGSGGESILVDGFAAARYLYDTAPEHYEILSRIPIISHASGDSKAGLITNTAKQRGYPVFNHDTTTAVTQYPKRGVHEPLSRFKTLTPDQLTQIRWNNDDRSSLTRFPSMAAMSAWYEAAKAWSEVLKMPRFEITVQLVPGRPVIFDNWRILHGRRAFTGERRVCGGYIGMDDYRARLLFLRRELGGREGLEQNG